MAAKPEYVMERQEALEEGALEFCYCDSPEASANPCAPGMCPNARQLNPKLSP